MRPKGDKNRKAVQWISDRSQEMETVSINSLVQQAISKFDLNPREAEELIVFYQRAQENAY